ncbi:hypothetical protein [Leifsonia shinshuensis]|uniref:Uncharacterized protein n=1 Tax=Leifsonia shinshuensis TaxID=150026 RepID=A0A7G6YA59_9MICO|nr:hypothetical protein [Leifsonia shinshuensis]QNE35374.1 hypothetical protein F1C12_09690 [Leifsonia shinshuensis]
MTSTFDLLLAHADEIRTASETTWEHDTDAADHATTYCEQWGVQRRDVHMFAALRQSKLLREAFSEKFDALPEVDDFEDFVNQLINVIDPHIDFDSLAKRVGSFVREYLPAGVVVTAPSVGYTFDDASVVLSHPSAPGVTCELHLSGEDASPEEILSAAAVALETWWYEVVGEPDLVEVAAMTAEQRE